MQAGQIHRDQLRGLGLSDDAIGRRARAGRLHLVLPSVFSLGHRRGDRPALLHAAVLSCGDGAALSYRAAAAHLDICSPYGGLIEVTVPAQIRPRPGLRVVRSRLPADEIVLHEDLPTTSSMRTLFDLASVLPDRLLRRAAKEVEIHGPPDVYSLADLLERHPRSPGAGHLRALIRIGEEPATVIPSDADDLFIELIRDAGLELPSHRYGIPLPDGWVEVDFAWPDLRVAVECDSSFHEGDFALDVDRDRDQGLIAAGWRVFRVTWSQLKRDPERVLRRLSKVLAAAERDLSLRNRR